MVPTPLYKCDDPDELHSWIRHCGWEHAARGRSGGEAGGQGGEGEDGGADTYRRGVKMMGAGGGQALLLRSSSTPEADKTIEAWGWWWGRCEGGLRQRWGPGLSHCCAGLFWLRLRNPVNSASPTAVSGLV